MYNHRWHFLCVLNKSAFDCNTLLRVTPSVSPIIFFISTVIYGFWLGFTIEIYKPKEVKQNCKQEWNCAQLNSLAGQQFWTSKIHMRWLMKSSIDLIGLIGHLTLFGLLGKQITKASRLQGQVIYIGLFWTQTTSNSIKKVTELVNLTHLAVPYNKKTPFITS